jgi:hypothetical protein
MKMHKMTLQLFLLGFVVAVEVDRNTDIDGNDGADHTTEGHGGKLVHKLDAEKDDETHKDEHHRPVHLHSYKGVREYTVKTMRPIKMSTIVPYTCTVTTKGSESTL